MPDVESSSLLLVAVIALLAPLTLGLAPRVQLRAVVLEIVFPPEPSQVALTAGFRRR